MTSQAVLDHLVRPERNKIRESSKMPFSITFQEFGPATPNLHNIVCDDVV